MSSVSQMLRQTREAKGISLEEVAQRTYIKLPYLVALEEGDIAKLPAPVYIHGYIRQYAKLLGLNGSDLVLQYQQEAGRSPAPKLSVSTSLRSLITSESDVLAQPPASAPTAVRTLPPDLREESLKRPAVAPSPIVEAPAFDSSLRKAAMALHPELRESLSREPALRETIVEAPTLLEEVPAAPVQAPIVDTPVAEAPTAKEPSLRENLPLPDFISPTAQEIQQAKMQAQQIIANAQREAQELRVAAERYADQVLAQLENEVNRSLQTVRNGRAFLQSRRRKLQES
ncbi:helix-turn-helix domain-containing protein [bacterium]|nr:helix-turn-helix domain-containing protein [bacterium]